MKININNIDQLTATVDRINGRATTHTTSVSSILSVANRATETLDQYQIPQSHRSGITLDYVPATNLPNCYRHQAITTHLQIRHGSKPDTWYLTHYDTITVWPKNRGQYQLVINRDTYNQTIAKLMINFAVSL